VKLKAQFPNKEGKLFPNQFVNVRMVVDVRRDAVLVPSAAIQRGSQGTVVYVVRDDSTVALKPVTTGAVEGQLTAIEAGLQAGERVVTDGVDRIREGAKVEVTEPSRGGGGRGQGMDPAKREELKKKMEGMTPEQRQEFMKKMREERKSAPDAKPVPDSKPAAAEPAPAVGKPGAGAQSAPQPAKKPDGKTEPAQTPPRPAPSAPEATRDDFRKSLEGMTPEQRREAIKKRMESMTPEQREAFRKRREAEGKAVPQ